jgi:hypothetical protein
MAAVSDVETVLEEATKCVEAAIRALDGAPLTGECSVKQHGILAVLESIVRRLADLCEEVEGDGH